MEDTENLFTCWLPRHTGIFSMFVLRRLFSGICLNPDLKATLKELPADAVIVYASKTKSYFEFLCYYDSLPHEIKEGECLICHPPIRPM